MSRLTSTIRRIRTSATDIDAMLRRLQALVAVDDSGSAEIDGYPAKSPGARESSGSTLSDPENLDDHVSRPTEDAALARLEQHSTNSDTVHRARLDAERHALAAATALEGLASALARADNLRRTMPTSTPQCFVAAVIHHLPADDTWIPGPDGRRTRFDGVIAHPWREERLVCRWVYDFTRRHGALPTREQCLEYVRTGYVRVVA